MNSKKFILKAKEAGLEASEIIIDKSTTLSFGIFNHEIDSYTTSTTSKILARGIYNGQIGAVSTENDDNDSIDFIINEIKNNASHLEKTEKPIIFEGSKKYHKKNVYSKKLDEWKDEDKISLLHKVEEKLYELDKRVINVEASFEQITSENSFFNSYNLKLTSKSNYFYILGSVVAKEGDETKTGYEIFLSSDPDEFNLDEFCAKIIKKATSSFNGISIKAKKYKTVFNPEVVASLTNALLSGLSAEEVQKHSSFFEGKLNTQVISPKITIDEKPLEKNCFFNYFDDEGVACFNKKVFARGKLLTYFYNLETAAKDGVESTGNGSRGSSSKVGISFNNIFIKPGKLSEEELFNKIKDGVYITRISGLHAGLDSRSGDFSLESNGFLVKDGKIASPLTLITISGNLFKLFNDVIAVGNNTKLTLSSVSTPSIAFKNVGISS